MLVPKSVSTWEYLSHCVWCCMPGCLPICALFFNTTCSLWKPPSSGRLGYLRARSLPSHLLALLALCRFSSCSSRTYPGSTCSSSSGIPTQCSRSPSFKVRPAHASAVVFRPAGKLKWMSPGNRAMGAVFGVQVIVKIVKTWCTNQSEYQALTFQPLGPREVLVGPGWGYGDFGARTGAAILYQKYRNISIF